MSRRRSVLADISQDSSDPIAGASLQIRGRNPGPPPPRNRQPPGPLRNVLSAESGANAAAGGTQSPQYTHEPLISSSSPQVSVIALNVVQITDNTDRPAKQIQGGMISSFTDEDTPARLRPLQTQRLQLTTELSQRDHLPKTGPMAPPTRALGQPRKTGLVEQMKASKIDDGPVSLPSIIFIYHG